MLLVNYICIYCPFFFPPLFPRQREVRENIEKFCLLIFIISQIKTSTENSLNKEVSFFLSLLIIPFFLLSECCLLVLLVVIWFPQETHILICHCIWYWILFVADSIKSIIIHGFELWWCSNNVRVQYDKLSDKRVLILPTQF